MKKVIYKLLTFTSIFVFTGCINFLKPDPNIEYDVGIPAATAIGENTFGCRINRVSWRAGSDYSTYINKTHIVGDSKFIYDRKNDSTTIIIKGACFRFVPMAFEKMSLQLKNKGIPKQNISYMLGNNASIDVNYFIDNSSFMEFNTNKLTNRESNFITLTRVDTTNKIVAGYFEGQLINLNKNKLTITEGRFDILLKKINYQ